MTLQLENVGRIFGSQWAVRSMNTLIQPSTTVAVLGPNGAGKSTLLRLIAGWLPLATGRISVEGFTLRLNAMSVRRRLMLLDEPPSNEASIVGTIAQTIDDYQVDREGIETEVANWFDKLDLVGTYGKTARAISKGQRYKVSLIGLFIVRPYVWLLDEPFSAGLDAGGLACLEREMRTHAEAGGIVLFSSQWPEHANRLADDAMVLHQGEMVCRQQVKDVVSDDLIADSAPSLTAVLSGIGR